MRFRSVRPACTYIYNPHTLYVWDFFRHCTPIGTCMCFLFGLAVLSAGLEPATDSLEGCCSIRLSYESISCETKVLTSSRVNNCFRTWLSNFFHVTLLSRVALTTSKVTPFNPLGVGSRTLLLHNKCCVYNTSASVLVKCRIAVSCTQRCSIFTAWMYHL